MTGFEQYYFVKEDDMIVFLEIIGTIAFAISGAVVGVQKKMDVFGVTILAMTTAVGGGIIRDIILNLTPPTAFKEPIYAFSAIAVGLTVFLIEYKKLFKHRPKFYDEILLWMDSIGLGIFTVSGIQVAFLSAASAGENVVSKNFLAIFVGVITGVGGGVMRDMMAGDKPYVFVKHFYATAAIIGAILCALLWDIAGQLFSMLIGAGVITVLRVLAAHLNWNLPRIE